MRDDPAALPDIDSLWDMRDPQASAARFRDLLPGAHAADDTSYLAEVLTQLARAEGLQGHFDGAHTLLDEAAPLITTEMPRARVRCLLERGRVFNSSGQPDAARPFFLEAWELANAVGDVYLAVDAAHMMGIVEPAEKQLAWNLRALEITEATTDVATKIWLGSLYNNLGWSYHDMGQFETALDYFQRGLARRRQAGQTRESRIAAWTVARALRSLERYDEAFAIQKDNLRAATAANYPAGFIVEELGELSLARHDGEAARRYFARAHALLTADDGIVRHEPERLERLRRLGGLADDVKS